MLEEAREQCDYLIVGLQVDPSLERPEKNRPVQSVSERYEQLRACKVVDEIIPYVFEEEISEILLSRRVDVRILGVEYKNKSFSGHEVATVENYFNERNHSYSTSDLRNRVLISTNNRNKHAD